MARGSSVRAGVTVLLAIAASAWLSADTLVLRDGRRVTGDLIAVRNGTIEFQERGASDGRVIRVSRDEVRRIELDEYVAPEPPARFERRDRPGFGWQGGGRPGGLRERDVTVASNVAFVDTGIEVRDGQMVYFDAQGEVTWGPGRKDGPAGEHDSPYNAQRPIPNRPAAALIGRVGIRSGDYFFIGDERGPIRMRSSGRLFLGVNDDYLQDNRGAFRVTVSY